MNLLKDPNKRKWVIVATMFIAIICNYLDRQLLSILKPEILEHFGIGDMQYAWIVNVFLICYALMYPVSGILVDRFGPKRASPSGRWPASAAAWRRRSGSLPCAAASWDWPSRRSSPDSWWP